MPLSYTRTRMRTLSLLGLLLLTIPTACRAPAEPALPVVLPDLGGMHPAVGRS